MLYAQTVAKSVAAVLTVLLGSGILSGHWFTNFELILAAINGGVVWAVPNRAKAIVTRTVPPAGGATVV